MDKLTNEARRRCLDLIRERKKMEDKLEADIESYESQKLEKFNKEKKEKELAEEERSIREDGLKYGENYAA